MPAKSNVDNDGCAASAVSKSLGSAAVLSPCAAWPAPVPARNRAALCCCPDNSALLLTLHPSPPPPAAGGCAAGLAVGTGAVVTAAAATLGPPAPSAPAASWVVRWMIASSSSSVGWRPASFLKILHKVSRRGASSNRTSLHKQGLHRCIHALLLYASQQFVQINGRQARDNDAEGQASTHTCRHQT
jgi:hypothetical protein